MKFLALLLCSLANAEPPHFEFRHLGMAIPIVRIGHLAPYIVKAETHGLNSHELGAMISRLETMLKPYTPLPLSIEWADHPSLFSVKVWQQHEYELRPTDLASVLDKKTRQKIRQASVHFQKMTVEEILKSLDGNGVE